MTPAELDIQASAWVAHRLAVAGSPESFANAWAIDRYDYLHEEPETLWLLILTNHRKNQSQRVQQLLSAGDVEDLLAKHGDQFIDRIEADAHADPSFAKLLGGVWKSQMSDEVWSRVQAVMDRRGWDGIPESRRLG